MVSRFISSFFNHFFKLADSIYGFYSSDFDNESWAIPLFSSVTGKD